MSFKRVIAESQIDNSCEALNSVVGNSKVVKIQIDCELFSLMEHQYYTVDCLELVLGKQYQLFQGWIP